MAIGLSRCCCVVPSTCQGGWAISFPIVLISCSLAIVNTLSFSKADFPEVADCKVGQEETLTVTIMPTSIQGDEVTADVTNVAYGEPAEEEAQDQAPALSKGRSPVASIGIPMRKSYA